MKFKLTRRTGKFGKGNFRNENHGNEKVPAVDFKVTCDGSKRDFDMLMPLLGDDKLSDVFYDEKGNLLTPYLSPIKVHRKPDNVTFKCWDQPTSKKDLLEFTECTVKDIEAQLKPKRNIIITLTLQLHDDPEKHSARLRRLMDTEREFELEAKQEDFFDEDPEEKKANKKGDQPELDLENAEEEDEE